MNIAVKSRPAVAVTAELGDIFFLVEKVRIFRHSAVVKENISFALTLLEKVGIDRACVHIADGVFVKLTEHFPRVTPENSIRLNNRFTVRCVFNSQRVFTHAVVLNPEIIIIPCKGDKFFAAVNGFILNNIGVDFTPRRFNLKP